MRRSHRASPPRRPGPGAARAVAVAPDPRGRPRRGGGRGGRVALLLLVLAAAAAAAYFGVQRMESVPAEEAGDSVVALLADPAAMPEPAPPPRAGPTLREQIGRPAQSTASAGPDLDEAATPPVPVIASSEEAVRERTRERFVSGTQAALADLSPVPDVWMRGEYVVLPSEHGSVRRVWEAYRVTARRVRAGDLVRYRTAYERALDDAGVQDPERRAARLDAATADFSASARAVREHWDRVESLALAAVQSHDALVEAEGLILHDPSGSTGRTSGLAVGTRGRSSDAQLLLDQVVQLLETALAADGHGPREGANVRAWVWDGFLDAVTR